MPTTVDPSAIFSGAPVSLTYKGVQCGATTAVPKFTLEVEAGAPVFTNAGGPVVGTRRNRRIVPSVELTVNEQTAQKLAWAMPGATATSSQSVGVSVAGLATTLSADPALNATTIGLTSVTTVSAGDFLLIGTTLTEALSEVVRVVTKGSAGATDTVIENSAGGGLLIDHASGENAKTCLGTILAAPAAAGATNIKVDAVTGSSALVAGNYIRIGYVGHYETRIIAPGGVGTAGAAGTGVTFTVPLTRDHSLDEWVVVVAASGSTVIRPTIGLIDDSEYGDLVLTDVGADGQQLVLTIEDAISAESQSMDFSDDPGNPLGLTLKFTGHYAAATPTQVPCTIELIP
jgi:hypothetical protein